MPTQTQMPNPPYLADHYTFEHRESPPPTYYGVAPSGYGSRIPTDHQVRVNGAGPWRRVYAICFSNAASHYVSILGRRYYFRTFDLSPTQCPPP